MVKEMVPLYCMNTVHADSTNLVWNLTVVVLCLGI